MNLARTYTRAGAVLLVLAVTAYCTAANEPLLAIAAGPGVLAGWLWTAPPRRRALPRYAVNLLLSAVVALAVLSAAAGNVGVESFAHFAVLLQLVKLGDRRRPRDDGQIILLAVFLMIAALLTDLGLAVGLQLFVLVPTLMAAVMLYQLQSAAEEAGASGAVVGAEAGRDRRWTRQFRRLLGVTALGVFVGAAAVFVAIPRGIGRDAFADMSGQAAGAVTGFNDTIVLGQRSVISESERAVMDVRIGKPGGPNLGAVGTIHYLRGAVLDEYADGQWTVRPGKRPQVIRRRDLRAGRYPLGSGARAPIEQQITIHDTSEHRGYLFALWRPASIEFDVPPNALHLNSGDRTMIREGTPGPLTYRVWSAAADPGIRDPRDRTPVSFPSKTVAELAASVLRESDIEPDPALRPIAQDHAAAAAIETHLRSKYTYTLEEEPIAPGRDPIERFLFESKRGHCEYFASAMVAMCRSVGINARVVTGFVASDFVEATGHYVVRANNAHAWVEAELGRGRWRTFDPTAPAELARYHSRPAGLFGGLQRVMEMLEYAWDRSIVSFDERSRARLLGTSASGEDERYGRRRWREREQAESSWLRWASTALALVVILVAGSGALVYAGRLLGWSWFRRGGAGRNAAGVVGGLPAEQARYYTQLLTLLARRGVPKPHWRPPLDHAAAIEAQQPGLAAVTAAVARIYYRARFGGRPLEAAEVAELRGLLRRAAEDPGSSRNPKPA